MNCPAHQASDAEKKPTIFVANADGFVESHLVAALVARGFPVRASVSRQVGMSADAPGQISPGLDHTVEYVPAGSHLASEWKRALGRSVYAVQVSGGVSRALPSPPHCNPEEQVQMDALRQAARSKGVRCVDIAPIQHQRFPMHRMSKQTGDDATSMPTKDLMAPVTALAHLTLSIPCPMGPLLDANIPGSMQVLRHLLEGEVRRIPRLGYEIVDVRDVTDWLIRQFEGAGLIAGRLTLNGTFAWMEDLAQMLRRRFPQFAHAIPEMHASDAYVLGNAVFNARARKLVGSLGKTSMSQTRDGAHHDFHPRHVSRTTIDAARSLILLNRSDTRDLSATPSLRVEKWDV